MLLWQVILMFSSRPESPKRISRVSKLLSFGVIGFGFSFDYRVDILLLSHILIHFITMIRMVLWCGHNSTLLIIHSKIMESKVHGNLSVEQKSVIQVRFH